MRLTAKEYTIGAIWENCPDALKKVNEILDNATMSGKHKPFDWKELGITGNLERLNVHKHKWMWESVSEDDDLANMVCRALFILQLREELKHQS